VPRLQTLPNGEDLIRQYDAAIAAGRPVEPHPSLPEGLRILFAGLANRVNSPLPRSSWSWTRRSGCAT